LGKILAFFSVLPSKTHAISQELWETVVSMVKEVDFILAGETEKMQNKPRTWKQEPN